MELISPMAVPGLHTPPSLSDLEMSRQAYNSLPDDADQPDVASPVLDQLKDLILKHNVQDKFGVHPVHGHVKIGENRVMNGGPMASLRGCYTRPTDIAQLDVANIHGHIFALDNNASFVAYEYRQGPPPEMTQDHNAFLIEMRTFLIENGLENIIGVQVLDTDKGKKLQEFVLSENHGAVMLVAADTNINENYCVTAWNVCTGHEGISELSGNETHSVTRNGRHYVITQSMPLPSLDEDAVVDALRKAGVIN